MFIFIFVIASGFLKWKRLCGFFLSVLYIIYVLVLEIPLSRGEGWNPIKLFNPATFCDGPNPKPGFPMVCCGEDNRPPCPLAPMPIRRYQRGRNCTPTENLSSTVVFSGVCVAQSSIFCVFSYLSTFLLCDICVFISCKCVVIDATLII